MVEIYSYHDRPPKKRLLCPEESRTQQHFKAEADINNIMKRYLRTGTLLDPAVPHSPGMYGDFSEVMDYQTAQNAIVAADAAFNRLPASMRSRFHNSPGELLAFLEDEGNREEAIKLGLVREPEKSAAPPE